MSYHSAGLIMRRCQSATSKGANFYIRLYQQLIETVFYHRVQMKRFFYHDSHVECQEDIVANFRHVSNPKHETLRWRTRGMEKGLQITR